MRVLKFGGSSLASVTRFLEVADIVQQQIGNQSVGLVLSAPQGVTNLLVELTDLAFLGSDYQPLLVQWKQRLAQLIAEASLRVNADQLKAVQQLADEQEQKLTERLQGISLLSYCPDHIKAQILGLGEQFSVALMTALVLYLLVSRILIGPIRRLSASILDYRKAPENASLIVVPTARRDEIGVLVFPTAAAMQLPRAYCARPVPHWMLHEQAIVINHSRQRRSARHARIRWRGGGA